MNITNKWLWCCAAFLLTAIAVVAQTNGVPVPGTDTPAPLPTNTAGYWELAIAGITPLIVTGIKKAVPKIPTMLLPVVTPFLGIALGFGLNALTKADLGWVDMAKAGALAVFVREVTNQWITKRMVESSTPPAK